MTDPAERRARDQELRALFADPALRHHESIAEAELDVDYGNSPIVMGDAHAALPAGQRLPDTIEVHPAGGQVGMLHELCFRTGHTALIIGGKSVHYDSLIRLDRSLTAGRTASVIEASVVLTARSDDRDACTWIAPAACDQLGIGEITLLVIRPDGHVGLRADSAHLEALAAYQALLVSSRTRTTSDSAP